MNVITKNFNIGKSTKNIKSLFSGRRYLGQRYLYAEKTTIKQIFM